MDEWLARMVMVVQTVGIVSISGLVAYWMRLRHQRKMLADQREVDQLRVEVDDLRSLTQAQIGELQERLDFADRLLAERRNPPLPGPKIPTPV